MSAGMHSKKPRIAHILISNWGYGDCGLCGQSRRSCEVFMVLQFVSAAFFDNGIVPKKEAEAYDYPRKGNIRIGTPICIPCAKRLSGRLDAVIERVGSAS